ncbi:MAG: DUF1801 domain-containing protein [Chitinophagales bacterium]|nr:DUF1801 domain-containing protein [Chitinophagales bacterium]MDW8418856.1 DUF1801 domain-containing protein [Chitinophagales bacterium]
MSVIAATEKEIKEFFEAYTPPVSDICLALLKVIIPMVNPPVKMWIDHADEMVSIGTEKTMKGEICYIKPLKDSVNLGFFHGAKLHDPDNLLQGTGKMLRHIKFRREPDVYQQAVKSLLEAAFMERKNQLYK